MNPETRAFVEACEARAAKATPGPIDVHRIDNQDGSISYQLQQAASAPRAKTDRDPIGARVLTQYDDIDNPDAKHDATFSAKAYEDLPEAVRIIREQAAGTERLRNAAQSVFDHYDNAASVTMPVEAHLSMRDLGKLLKSYSNET